MWGPRACRYDGNINWYSAWFGAGLDVSIPLASCLRGVPGLTVQNGRDYGLIGGIRP